jgi:hypothetical protein
MDKVVAALETSLASAREPALRARLIATIERLRGNRDREGGRRQPRGNAARKTTRGEDSKRSK